MHNMKIEIIEFQKADSIHSTIESALLKPKASSLGDGAGVAMLRRQANLPVPSGVAESLETAFHPHSD